MVLSVLIHSELKRCGECRAMSPSSLALVGITHGRHRHRQTGWRRLRHGRLHARRCSIEDRRLVYIAEGASGHGRVAW